MIFHFAWGTPVRKRADRQQQLEELQREYRGIYWDTAADPNECTDEQFDILAETLRVVVNDVMPLAGTHLDRSASAAFNRFFIRPVEPAIPNGWGQNHVMVDKYRDILGAMDFAGRFPTNGKKDRKGNYVRAKQIKFRCKAFPGVPCTGKIGARTSRPGLDPDDGWVTVFCPYFFQSLKYINDIGNGPSKIVSQLPTLSSFEHAMIHELMHADIATGRAGTDHITDMVSTIPGYDGLVKIYGALTCHDFAWKFTNFVVNPGVNPEVSINADNYAWYFSNEWFAKRWNWQNNGRSLAIDASENGGIVDMDFTDPDHPEGTAPVNFGTTPRPNCIYLSDVDPYNNWYCAYMGTDLDTWIAERDEPFMSAGNCLLS